MFGSNIFPPNVPCENIMDCEYIPWGGELAKDVA
jgi:hypothetical protein